MPFIGQDWRSPGDAWVKTSEGWEPAKLRPFRSGSDVSLDLKLRARSESESSLEYPILFDGAANDDEPDTDEVPPEPEEWQPHCFVKTGKSKEFIGCTSMGEAFQKLDLARASTDIRRFNYICKVVQILVKEKLQNLSGSARKILLGLVEAVVMHCLDRYCELQTVRLLVQDFLAGLTGGTHHCGSPKLLIQHQDAVSNLFQLLNDVQITTPADSTEDALTFLDLPQECLRAILRQLPDHNCLLTAAKASEALTYCLLRSEHSLWRDLCFFHFTERQVDQITEKLRRFDRHAASARLSASPSTKPVNASSSFPRASSPTQLRLLPSMVSSSIQESSVLPHTAQSLPTAAQSPSQNSPNNCAAGLAEGGFVAQEEEADKANSAVNYRRVYFECKKFFGLREVYADSIHICCYCKALHWKGVGHPCIAKEPAPSVRVMPNQFIDMLST